MTEITNSVVNLIGSTPIVKLNRVVPKDTADAYVELEFSSPGGSIKDRIALAMIEEAEKAGKLRAGGTIVEPTSGSIGVGLTMVAAAKGYHLVVTIPETVSVERWKLMRGYGAELILTPGADGMKGIIAKAEELAKERGCFMPMQFDNPTNPTIHEETTGKEILEASGDGILDTFVAGVGTGGTLIGTGHALKKANPSVRIYTLEPAESPVLKEEEGGKHKIQGISADFTPKVLDTDVYSGVLKVKSGDAIAVARKVDHQEGILVGISAGANIRGTTGVAKELGKGKQVITVAPDGGNHYLSTELFSY